MKMQQAIGACVAAAGLILTTPAAAVDFSLSYLGQQIVPTGTVFSATTVGGLSGIDYVAATGRYVAISDDRSGINPARYYDLSLDLNQFQRSATPGMAGVTFNAVTTIQKPGGGAFAVNTVDPEGIRYNPATNSLYWSNEGQRAPSFQVPTVREMTVGGAHVRDFSVPGRYNPLGTDAGTSVGDRGIYNNLAFETMALSSDGKTLYTATENALSQDGPQAKVTNGSSARILSFDVASGLSQAEYVYNVAPVVIPPNPAGIFATNGLTDMVAIGDRQFIAIERSFAIGAVTPGTPVTGNTIRLFHVDARNATDVSGMESIVGQTVQAVTKTQLLDLSDLKNDDNSALALDNIEGITFGPMVDGKATLILVSDNNFSGTQFTQFVALQVNPVPEPETWALMLAGLALAGGMARRQSARRA